MGVQYIYSKQRLGSGRNNYAKYEERIQGVIDSKNMVPDLLKNSSKSSIP